jgi:hypothetical protein
VLFFDRANASRATQPQAAEILTKMRSDARDQTPEQKMRQQRETRKSYSTFLIRTCSNALILSESLSIKWYHLLASTPGAFRPASLANQCDLAPQQKDTINLFRPRIA